MRKGIIIILLSVILSTTACTKSLESTNLTYIKIDDIKLDKPISDFDFDKYTESNSFEEKENTHNFEEIRIETDEDKAIKEIRANVKDVNLYINEIKEFSTIENVTNVLGESYKNYWYDKEQGLRSNQYVDSKNKIKADFVYSIHENKLVWILLNKQE